MKKVLLTLLLIIVTIVAFSKTITLENRSYSSIRVSFYYSEYGTWSYMNNYYLRPNETVSIEIGNDPLYLYGYSSSNTTGIQQFYATWITLY